MATLSDVVSVLSENKKEQEETGNILQKIKQSFDRWFVVQQDSKLSNLETEIENRRVKRSELTDPEPTTGKTLKEVSADIGDIFRGSFLGTFAARAISPATALLTKAILPIGAILLGTAKFFDKLLFSTAPWKNMFKSIGATLAAVGPGLTKTLISMSKLFGKLFLKGSVLYLIYDVFNDISDNKDFKESMSKISDTWNNRIVPAWSNFKNLFNNFLQTEKMQAAIQYASEVFDTIVNGMTNIWDNSVATIQKFVGNTLETVVNTIAGAFDGITMIFNGNVKQGIGKLINTLLIGIQDGADAVFTGILELFGVDFGEDGSLLGWMDSRFENMVSGVRNQWENFTITASNAWSNYITPLGDYALEKMSPLVASIQDRWSNLTSGISSTWSDNIQPIIENVTNSISSTFALVQDKWDSFISLFTVDLPNKIDQLKQAGLEKISNVKDTVSGLVTSVIDGFIGVREFVSAFFSYGTTKLMNDFKAGWEGISNKFKNIPDQMYLLLAENFKFVIPEVSVPIPFTDRRQTIIPRIELGVGDQASIQQTEQSILQRNTSSSAEIERLNNETAAALQRAVDTFQAIERAVNQTVIINQPAAPAPAASSQGSTNIMMTPVETFDKHMAPGNAPRGNWQ